MRTYILVLLALACLALHVTGQDKKMFCYYSSDARWRSDYGRFQPSDIDPFLCTHVIVAFAKVLPWGLGPNVEGDEKPTGWNALYAKTAALKKRNPNLRVLLAVGGWKEGSKPFKKVIETENTISKWAENAVTFLRQHNLDGMDMDWEFPGVRGSVPSDKYKFTILLKTFQEKLQEEARLTGNEKMILTLATAAGLFFIDNAYETTKIHKYLDYMLLMTYNYHGLWEKNVGHHSSITPSEADDGERKSLCQNWTVQFWKQQGVPNEKLILGLATYGMSYTLMNPSNTWIGANATGGGKGGRITKEPGILAYYEICENIRFNSWTKEWIEEQNSPYAFGGDQWVGYDDVNSIGIKANYINSQNLGGAFIWSVEMDDFTGKGCGLGKYPLLRRISEIIRPANEFPNEPPIKKPSPVTAPPAWKPPTRKPRPEGVFPSINRIELPDNMPLTCAENGAGLWADEEDCHGYYSCTDYMGSRMSCGPYMAFDPESNNCGYTTDECPPM
ncbi:chitinase-3-like protein 2 [Haliotis cracherodii]|uniref:chitinase-3-like protein 2 n=1 Tax=Haliotis cracherodii TaxID=6455 RepID=UPI0039E7466A